MAGKVILTVTEGSHKGDTFPVDTHNTLFIGRMDDCQIYLEDDLYISRHHCVIEINPPDVCVRDLGSLHGTYINGKKYGGREKGQSPEEGAKSQYPTVDIRDSDTVKVGHTVLQVKVEISSQDKADAAVPVQCQKCGKNVTAEVGSVRRGNYICESCRQQADPGALLLGLIQKALDDQEGQVKANLPSPDPGTPGDSKFQIPDYEIENELGKGGMGIVYRVRHKRNRSKAALKIMLAKIAVDEKARNTFLREIEVTKSLSHPNVVKLIDTGAIGSVFYFLLEYCDGGSIYDLMRKRGNRLPLAEAGPLMLQAIDGLAYIHEMHVVHRDLKPQNILLTSAGNGWAAKVADMGLAKNFDNAGLSGMTATGSVIGTFAFMPREQVMDYRGFKPISDVWAMGATCYNILTGQIPREPRHGQHDPLTVILDNDVIPIRKRDSQIPLPIAEVIDRAIADDMRKRFQTAREFHDALAKALARVK